jgi:hypothetical protein
MSDGAPKYDAMFLRLEKLRWDLGDVPFNDVDKALVSEDTLQFLRVNCLMELSSLYAQRMFMRDFRELPDFCQFTSIWYYEEMKHYLVLREYLKLFDRAPDIREYPDLDTELAPGPWPETLAMHYCGELRLGMWYHRWSDEAEEPVLSSIYKRIGNDEFRHAGCYREFMEQAISEDQTLLPQFLNAAKWMLYNPDGDKHPTTMNVDESGQGSVTDRIEGYEVVQAKIHSTINDADELRLQQQVLATLSRLAGKELKTLRDLSVYSRQVSVAIGEAKAG